MKTFIALGFLALEALSAQPQQKGTIAQNTGGVCSQAVVAGGNVTITCQGLDDSQRQILLKVPALLDQILKKQVDQKALVEKLDEVLKGQNVVLRELLTMREAAAPRVLKPEVIREIVQALVKYKGQEFTLASVVQDREAFEFGGVINTILTSAGWKAKDLALGRLMPVGQPPTGIELSAATAESEAGLALLNALHRSGIEIRGVLQPTMAPNEIRIQVYSKAH
jgi:hypothetical protein